eukprot:762450-Hanusia_phi.AAC.2
MAQPRVPLLSSSLLLLSSTALVALFLLVRLSSVSRSSSLDEVWIPSQGERWLRGPPGILMCTETISLMEALPGGRRLLRMPASLRNGLHALRSDPQPMLKARVAHAPSNIDYFYVDKPLQPVVQQVPYFVCEQSKEDYNRLLEAGQISKEEQELHEIFAYVDADHSGCVSAYELYMFSVQLSKVLPEDECLSNPVCGLKYSDCTQIIRAMDSDGNNMIDFFELEQFLILKSVFDSVDRDHTGFLNTAELCEGLMKLGRQTQDCRERLLYTWGGEKTFDFMAFKDFLLDSEPSKSSIGL